MIFTWKKFKALQNIENIIDSSEVDYVQTGTTLCFCVYVFNVQPGIEIDYTIGDSKRAN